MNMFYAAIHTAESNGVRQPCMTFFKNHQNLRRLSCRFYSAVGLVEFFDELPNLEEMQMVSHEYFDINLVIQLIANHKNLLKFQYQVSYRNNPDAFYRETFGNEWHITHIMEGATSTLTLKKKN